MVVLYQSFPSPRTVAFTTAIESVLPINQLSSRVVHLTVHERRAKQVQELKSNKEHPEQLVISTQHIHCIAPERKGGRRIIQAYSSFSRKNGITCNIRCQQDSAAHIGKLVQIYLASLLSHDKNVIDQLRHKIFTNTYFSNLLLFYGVHTNAHSVRQFKFFKKAKQRQCRISKYWVLYIYISI